MATDQSRLWRARHDGVEFGPYTDAEIFALFAQGRRELAIASGRRAVITRVRVRNSEPLLWTVHIADTQTNEVYEVWTRLTKREVLSRWRLWSERKTECVLIAWPQWLPQPTITFDRAG